MKDTNILNEDFESRTSIHITRTLTLTILGVVLLLMFSLALAVNTANAATLTRELQVGSKGQDVSDLQAFLATDSTVYPQGLVTGYFGLLTKAAVSNFQSKNNISAVGRVGPITMGAINSQMNNGSSVGFDKAGPIISSVSISPTNSSATISWNTNEVSSGIIYYNTVPVTFSEGGANGGINVSGTSLLTNTGLQIAHSGTLTSLNANTTYYYVVYARDASGNENITWPSTFQTN